MKRNENSGGQASMGLSAQTILLIRLKLRNCLGLNEVIHGKDGRKSLRLTGMPVSYTHLDVYKRQFQRSFEAAPSSDQRCARGRAPRLLSLIHI